MLRALEGTLACYGMKLFVAAACFDSLTLSCWCTLYGLVERENEVHLTDLSYVR